MHPDKTPNTLPRVKLFSLNVCCFGLDPYFYPINNPSQRERERENPNRGISHTDGDRVVSLSLHPSTKPHWTNNISYLKLQRHSWGYNATLNIFTYWKFSTYGKMSNFFNMLFLWYDYNNYCYSLDFFFNQLVSLILSEKAVVSVQIEHH